MRASNILLLTSTIIILGTAVIVLSYQAFFGPDGQVAKNEPADKRSNSADKAPKGEQRESNSETPIVSAPDTMESLRHDLAKSKQLLQENDDQIFQLNAELEKRSAALTKIQREQIQLSQLLNCSPNDLLVRTKFLLNSHDSLRQRLQSTLGQLAALNRQQPTADPSTVRPQREPLIKPMRLTGPVNDEPNSDELANKNEPGEGNSEKPDGSNEEKPSDDVVAKSNDAKNNTGVGENASGAAGDSGTEPVESAPELIARIRELESDLRNREKLLLEQTSLIEDLKDKTGRVETTFRSFEKAGNPQGQSTQRPLVESSPAFRDRGTYKATRND